MEHFKGDGRLKPKSLGTPGLLSTSVDHLRRPMSLPRHVFLFNLNRFYVGQLSDISMAFIFLCYELVNYWFYFA
jgi:hypothetical protein